MASTVKVLAVIAILCTRATATTSSAEHLPSTIHNKNQPIPDLEWTRSCHECPKGYISPSNSPCNGITLRNTPICPPHSNITCHRCMSHCEPSRTSCAFYQCLDANYNGCGKNGYPIGYGFKYCTKYAVKAHEFSPKGQTWIDTTRLCLEKALVPASTNGSMSCHQLSEAAFATHADCYVKSGVCHLPHSDLRHILGVVGIHPWIAEFLDTFTEAWDVGTDCGVEFMAWQVPQFAEDGVLEVACEAVPRFGKTSHCKKL